MPGSKSVITNHSFVLAPHRTMLSLSAPVLLSLIAEPMTGLVDTAFVARLGAAPLAALGVGTAALSSLFWAFNFLGIGSQTEVAQAEGRGETDRAARVAGIAFVVGGTIGLALIVLGTPLTARIAELMGADAQVRTQAVAYMQIRLLGAPAVLGLLVAFGVMRGQQDMRTPLWVALAVNAINGILDAILVGGWGPLPGFGIAGVAVASTFAQWVGVAWALAVVVRRLGWPQKLQIGEAKGLLGVGGDLFLRTSMLTLFLLLATRAATLSGAENGAAHQAIRQFWIFAALGLDALAITAQSLVGYFIGSHRIDLARRVASVSCLWGGLFGLLLALFMLVVRTWLAGLLVPPEAQAVFWPAWFAAAIVQPVNALAFVTDGINWGTADFRYLRNVMFISTGVGVLGLLLIDSDAPNALTWIWIVSALWIAVRAGFGLARVWPGIGHAPLRAQTLQIS